MYAQITNDIAQDYYRQNFPNDGQRFVACELSHFFEEAVRAYPTKGGE